MVAAEGRQLVPVTSNNEFEFAKQGLTSLGLPVKEPNKKHPDYGATAKKQHLIKGVSDGGNLFSWNLNERGVSNFGCSSVPKGLTSDGRYEETNDLVQAKVHDDGIEYGKNTFNNNPTTFDWDASSDHRN